MKRNRLLIYLSLILLSFSSCKEENETERVSIEPIMVKTDLLTSMPGNLLAIEDKLIWFDLNPDAFLHIEDEKPETHGQKPVHWEADRKTLMLHTFHGIQTEKYWSRTVLLIGQWYCL